MADIIMHFPTRAKSRCSNTVKIYESGFSRQAASSKWKFGVTYTVPCISIHPLEMFRILSRYSHKLKCIWGYVMDQSKIEHHFEVEVKYYMV